MAQLSLLRKGFLIGIVCLMVVVFFLFFSAAALFAVKNQTDAVWVDPFSLAPLNPATEREVIEQVTMWFPLAQQYAHQFNLPTALVLAIMMHESHGDPEAYNANCVDGKAGSWGFCEANGGISSVDGGLMQVNSMNWPSSDPALNLGSLADWPPASGHLAFNPDKNVHVGTSLLMHYLKEVAHGCNGASPQKILELGIDSYNAGVGNVLYRKNPASDCQVNDPGYVAVVMQNYDYFSGQSQNRWMSTWFSGRRRTMATNPGAQQLFAAGQDVRLLAAAAGWGNPQNLATTFWGLSYHPIERPSYVTYQVTGAGLPKPLKGGLGYVQVPLATGTPYKAWAWEADLGKSLAPGSYSLYVDAVWEWTQILPSGKSVVVKARVGQTMSLKVAG